MLKTHELKIYIHKSVQYLNIYKKKKNHLINISWKNVHPQNIEKKKH